MEKPHLIGLVSFAVLATAALAMRPPEEAKRTEASVPKSHVRLAAISTSARMDV